MEQGIVRLGQYKICLLYTSYKADPGVLKQLKVIKEVFDQCDKIIVATDAGREGELIHRYICLLYTSIPTVRTSIRRHWGCIIPGS